MHLYVKHTKPKINYRNALHSFTATSNEKISPQDAMKAQRALGYDPAGYNFLNFQQAQRMHLDTNQWFASWQCYTSCD